jgi:perosamine synthetase
VKEKITNKTKTIVPVHLFGNAANMKALVEIAADHKSYLVNDAAQAHGTTINNRDVGSLDDLNCYSFYPTKSMTTGEGGLTTTNNKELYKKGKLILNHGQESRYYHKILGLNYRLPEIPAVMGLNQLAKLDEFLAKRRKNAKVITEGVKKISGLKPQKITNEVNSSYSYYTIIMDLEEYDCSRDQFIEALKAENVDCMVYYPVPLSKQTALREYVKVECPVSEKLAKKVFSVPVHPELADQDPAMIIEALQKVSDYYLK